MLQSNQSTTSKRSLDMMNTKKRQNDNDNCNNNDDDDSPTLSSLLLLLLNNEETPWIDAWIRWVHDSKDMIDFDDNDHKNQF
jgi:hypothetical protein